MTREELIEHQREEIKALKAANLDLQIHFDTMKAELHDFKECTIVRWPDSDEIMQMAFEEGQPTEDASGYYFELEEFDMFIERLRHEFDKINGYTPHKILQNGWKLTPLEPTGIMTLVGQKLRYDSVNSIGEIYRQMLAVAPAYKED